MVFKITAVKSVDDPAERRQRLAALFAVFEKTAAPDDILADESDAATNQATEATRRGHHTMLQPGGKISRVRKSGGDR